MPDLSPTHGVGGYLSATRLQTYLGCSLKYAFRYVERREPEFHSPNLAFGRAVHSTLATYHQSVLEGAPFKRHQVLALFEADLAAETVLPLSFSEGESAETLRVEGLALLGAYLEEVSFEVRGAEQSFTVPLVDPFTGELVTDKPLFGYLDLVTPEGVVELKTGKRKLSEAQLASHLQLSAYAYAFFREEGYLPRIQVVGLLRQKQPTITVQETSRTLEELRRFVYLARAVEQAIGRSAFAPNPGWLCGSCEYAEACQRWPETRGASAPRRRSHEATERHLTA